MADSAVTCPVCGESNRAGRRFCSACGAALPVICTTCGAQNEPGDRFCGQCGSPLGGSEAAPARAVPEPVAPAPELPADKERRLVTVLFADLVGSTTLGEQMDPEEVDELVASVHGRIEESIGRYGGHVVRHMGDGLMALFGAPVAREDDAERAVLAGLDMQRSLLDLNARRAPGASEVAMRVGITSGEVVAGTVAGVYDVTGDAANTAARLQAAADPGGVLVGQETMRLARRRIHFDERRDLTLKGKSSPVPVYRALRVRERMEERWELSTATPFVGRGRELSDVLDAWERARDGDGQIVTVIGDPGVGKSRMLSETLHRIGDGARAIRARCLSYSEAMSLWLVADLLRSLCHIGEQDAPESARSQLEGALSDLLADQDEATYRDALDVLGEVLGLRPAESSTSGAAQVRRQILIRGLRLLLPGICRDGPVVIVLEDLHWIDAASRDVLAEVLADVPLLPLLVLASQRSGWTAPWNEWSWPERLTLHPLRNADGAALAQAVLDGAALSPELERYVSDRAGGNPFFVEELLRSLRERGHLVVQDDQTSLAPGAADRLPSTLTEVLLARLDRLDARDRGVAQVASVFGRSFDARLLAAVMGEAETVLDASLTALQRAEMAFPRAGPNREYVFKHATMREATYGTLVHRRRQQLHLAAARAIARLNTQDDLVDVIAYHYARSDEPCEAAPALERAGDRAAGVYAGAAALEWYREARQRQERCPPNGTELARLDEKLGITLRTLGAYDDALDALERAWRFHQAAEDREREGAILAQIGETHYLRGTSGAGIERLEPCVGRHEISDMSVVAALQEALTLLYFACGRYADALAAAEEASDSARTTGEVAALARADVSRALALLALGRRGEAREVLEGVLPLAERAGDLETLVRALDNLSNVHYFRGEMDESRRYLLRALEIAERMGDPSWRTHLLFMLGTNRFWVGEWDASWQYLERSHAVAQGLGESRASALPLYGMGQVLMQRGEWEEATRLLEQAAAVFDRNGILPVLKWAERQMAEREVLEGHPEAALARLLPLLARQGLEDSATLLPVVARAHIALGQEEAAEDAIGRALARARADEDVIDLEETLIASVQLAALQRRWDAADAAVSEGVSLTRTLHHLYELARFLYEDGRLRLARGDADGGRRCLEEADEIFRRLGARWYGEQTTRLLAEMATA